MSNPDCRFAGLMGTTNHPGPPPNGPQPGADDVSAGQRPVEAGLERLAALIASSPHNLVAAGERAEVYDRHVRECDALSASLSPSGRWMDLGTGGGLPGLVLALRHPSTHWVLVDATRKKADAVAEFARDLGLVNVTVLHGRAETLARDAAHRGAYDGVVSRAVAPLATLAELCRGFLRNEATMVAVKGPRWREELRAAGGALATLRLGDVHTAELADVARPTWVVTMRADGPPPADFPRRDGIPKQDPLQ